MSGPGDRSRRVPHPAPARWLTGRHSEEPEFLRGTAGWKFQRALLAMPRQSSGTESRPRSRAPMLLGETWAGDPPAPERRSISNGG